MRVDSARLWAALMHSATIGATKEGGLCRLALGPQDLEARGWFAAECTTLGATITVDAMGSQFALFAGTDPERDPIAMGSHLDTQPTGGRFDGVLGVLGALECVRALRAAGQSTRHALLVINWTNEEGARFAPAMVASGVSAGAISRAQAYAATDATGITLQDALAQAGVDIAAELKPPKLAAYFELHIEQGPVLEAENAQIGVVVGVQGIAWFDIEVHGRASHAGTTPMTMRRDPMQASAAIVGEIARLCRDRPAGLFTIGAIQAAPGARNTVPETVRISLDLRNPTAPGLMEFETAVRAALPSVTAAYGCTMIIDRIWHSPPVSFAPSCIAGIRAAASMLGPARAGHHQRRRARCRLCRSRRSYRDDLYALRRRGQSSSR